VILIRKKRLIYFEIILICSTFVLFIKTKSYIMDLNQLTASKIKELRLGKGYTIEALAQELGIAKGNYSRMENGKVDITLKRLEALSQILKEPVESLLSSHTTTTLHIHAPNNSQILNQGTQINHYNAPEVIQALQSTVDTLQKVMEKLSA
jgi:transcriptional regulator with XRE-family HTH domain